VIRSGLLSSRPGGLRIAWAALVVLAALGAAPARANPAEVTRATLSNGLRVVVVRSALAPVVTTELNYLVGSDEAPAGFPGTAHALEHLMFRGSPGLSAPQLADIMAAMGGEFNAETQETVTQYYFTVPAGDLDLALRVEAARMRGLSADPRLWRQERGAIEQEVAQDLSNPEYMLATELRAHLFAGSPYAVDALGTRPSFQKTSSAMLRRFHRTWYAPNNAILVIAGDVDPTRVLRQVNDAFGGLPARPVPPRPLVKLGPLAPKRLDRESDLPYGLAVVAYRLPGFESADWAAAQVLADVLQSRRGRLFALAADGKALEVQFEAEFLPKAGMGLALAAFPQGEDGEGSIQALRDVIARDLQDGFPEELVEAAKRRELADAELAKGSIPGLAAEWSQALAVEGRESPEQDLDAIRKVTVADVNRVARAWLVDRTAATAVLRTRASGRAVVGHPFKGGESFTLRDVKPVKLPAWAARLRDPPRVISSGLHPASMVLENGLRLIVQPVPDVPMLVLLGRVKTDPDLQVPLGQEGVSDVLEQLLAYGTASLDRIAFQRALDDLGATATAGTAFGLQVPVREAERGVQLLAENLLQPALPEAGFEIVRKQVQDTVAGLLRTPTYLAEREVGRALYPEGDPARREPSLEALAKLRLEDVRQYHQRVFRPDLTSIVVLGAVTPEEARRLVEQRFGAWRATGPRPQTDPPPVPPNRPSASRVPDRSTVQDEVTLAETVSVTRSHPDYYPLQLGNHVLAGAFYATRLVRDLREKAGLVYSVDANLNAGRTRTVYQITYACDPDKAGRARALVARDLRQLQTRPISDAELQLARALLVRRIPLSEASLEQIGRGILELSVDDLPLDEPARAADRYLEITPAEVRAAFARWIRPDGFAQVSIGPAP
jgi:zinc protease